MDVSDQNISYSDSALISVIIPTYNRLDLLKEAITSVKAQTHKNWELIIVDDGSTDETVQQLARVDDHRLHVIPVDHKGHLGILRNIGAANSNGEWFAFLDSDDLWTTTKLEKQLEVLRKEKTKWIYSASELVDENKNPIPKKSGKAIPYSGWIAEQILTTEADFAIS